MPYVERDRGRAITGVYEQPQPGYAEELAAADAAEVVSFHERVAAALAPPVITAKADLFRRMTEAEAATFAAVKATQPLRMQLLFDGASELRHDAPEWPLLERLFVESFGRERAAVLLA